MSAETTDVINLLAGIEPGSSLDGIRTRRLQARENAQKSYVALFEPADFRDFAAADRYAVAAFVAGVHAEPAAASFYLAQLARAADRSAPSEALKTEIERAKTEGPYGAFPAGPLSVEDKVGLIYHVGETNRGVLGARLSAAFEHAHLLVFRPRDADAACHTGTAGCRLVEYRDRNSVATRSISGVSDAGRRRAADAWRVAPASCRCRGQSQLRSKRIMSDSIVVQDHENLTCCFHPGSIGLAALA